MADGHPSSCAHATIGSVCLCECSGVRHSVAINGGVPAPASAVKGAKGTPTEGYVSPVAQADASDTDGSPAEPAASQGQVAASLDGGPLTGDAARRAAPASLTTGRGLTDEQEGGLGFYRATGFEIVNDYLRGDPRFGQYYAGTEALADERVGVIDSAMNNSRLTGDAEVWRGIENPQRLFGDALDGDMTGATWTERAYLSTTTDEAVAGRFAGASTSDPGVVMRITAPEGTGAVELSGADYESELLMERDLELRVTADHGVDERGVRHLDVEIVPATRSDGDEGAEPDAAQAPADAPGGASPAAGSVGTFDERVSAAASGDAARTSPPGSLARNTGITDGQREALSEYADETYDPINRTLREPDGDVEGFARRGFVTPEQVQGWIGEIDAAMDSSPLPEDVTTWRGIRSGQVIFGDQLDGDLTGAEWTEHAYVSTTTDVEVADGFAGANPGAVQMRILTPAGTGAIEITDSVDRPGRHGESELLLQRGLRMRVVADHGVDARGVRQLDVEVLPAA